MTAVDLPDAERALRVAAIRWDYLRRARTGKMTHEEAAKLEEAIERNEDKLLDAAEEYARVSRETIPPPPEALTAANQPGNINPSRSKTERKRSGTT